MSKPVDWFEATDSEKVQSIRDRLKNAGKTQAAPEAEAEPAETEPEPEVALAPQLTFPETDKPGNFQKQSEGTIADALKAGVDLPTINATVLSVLGELGAEAVADVPAAKRAKFLDQAKQRLAEAVS